MKTTQRLVVQSAVLGSLFIGFFGFLVVPAKATIQGELPIQISAVEGQELASPELQSQVQVSSGFKECSLHRQLPEKVYRWCNLIHQQAVETGLDPDLVAAVILVESAGDPLAYSHSGAVGLMQVMPRDGLAAAFQCPNGPCFTSRPTRRELEDPVFNVSYGSQMLAGLVEKYGNIRTALKAYGPMDVGFAYADKVLGVWERNAR